jgi:hypothetical protein
MSRCGQMPASDGPRRPALPRAIMYLLVAAIASGCNSSPDPRAAGRSLPEGTSIVVIGPPQSAANCKPILGGARSFAAPYPHIQLLTAAPADDQPQTLLQLCQDLMNQNPAAVCLYVERPDVARAAAELITRGGALLVTMGRSIPGILSYGHVEVALPEAAEILGRSLPSILPPAQTPSGATRTQRSYILLHEDGRDSTASDCYARFLAAAPGPPEFTRLTERNAANTSTPPQKLIEQMLAEFRSAELVVTLTPQPWLDPEQRFRLPRPGRFVTLSAVPRLWPRLLLGEAAALVGPLDGEIGYAAAELAVQGLMLVPDAPRRRSVRCELVTADRLEDFARRYAAAAGIDPAELLPIPLEPATQREVP